MTTSSDRASVAREVLTEVRQLLAGNSDSALALPRFDAWVSDEFPAPPAPETVTVADNDGVLATYVRDTEGAWLLTKCPGLVPSSQAKLDRIASDARVLQERDESLALALREIVARDTLVQKQDQEIVTRDARIAELEDMEHALRAQIHNLKVDCARISGELGLPPTMAPAPGEVARVVARIAELEKETSGIDAATVRSVAAVVYGDSLPPAWQTMLASNVERIRAERDAALRALEERANTAGPTGGEKRASVAGSTPAPLVPASPAPIPLGAVVEVEGDTDSPYRKTETGWEWGPRPMPPCLQAGDDSDYGKALTALYRARHPVATRETVERVYDALARGEDCNRLYWWGKARAALRAAGVTLEEGA